MEKVYYFYGTDEFLVNNKVEEILGVIEVDEFNVMRYDLLESAADDVLQDLQTVSFFGQTKVVIVKNIALLNKEESYKIEKWLQYFKNPNPETVLIIVDTAETDQANEIGKAIFSHAYIEKIEEIKKEDYPKYVLQMLKKYQYTITESAVSALIERANYDFNLISQELEKLMLFCYEQKEITEKAVTLLVSRNLEENIYELTHALLYHNQTQSIEIFYDLMARNEDPLRILNQIITKIRELIHVKLLIDKSYTQDQIAQHFNIKSGKAYYLIKDAKSVTFSVLENYLKRLSELDYEIKSGKTDKRVGLEFFLLGV